MLAQTAAANLRLWHQSARRHDTEVVKSGTARSWYGIFNRPTTMPVVCGNGSLTKTVIVMVTQNRIAAFKNTAG
jgi:hypothetical protein